MSCYVRGLKIKRLLADVKSLEVLHCKRHLLKKSRYEKVGAIRFNVNCKAFFAGIKFYEKVNSR